MKDARRLTATVPANDGTDPVEVRSDSLDPKAVVDSLRLSGSWAFPQRCTHCLA